MHGHAPTTRHLPPTHLRPTHLPPTTHPPTTYHPPTYHLQVYEQYVVGMLTNLESLPLDRIHNMLKMFVQSDDGNGGYDRTEQARLRGLSSLLICPSHLPACAHLLRADGAGEFTPRTLLAPYLLAAP